MESAPARRDCQAIILIKLFCTKKRVVKQKSAGSAMPRNRTESGEFRRVFSAGSIMRASGGCLLEEHRAVRLRAGRVLRRDFGADAFARGAGAEILVRGKWSMGKGQGRKRPDRLAVAGKNGRLADALFCRIVFSSPSRGSCVKTARQWNDTVVPKPVPCSALGGRAGAERLGQPRRRVGRKRRAPGESPPRKGSCRAPCPTGKRRNKVHFFLFLRQGGGKMD